ncbi:MAG: DNA repair protein RecO [Chloroflexi bacterium]|nr:DNA repair protein RecO [Chloroflexota bacterium]MCL5075604.1 DNA repair protein RecO [Chloroflexota bacterium]
MAKPHVYRTEGIVLRHIDLGEADRIVTLYTPYLGKVRAVAKGTRRTTSKLAGHLELFTHSQLLMAKGRNLDIITQGQTINSFLALRGDLLRTTHAHYVAELLDRFTEEHIENYPLFTLTVHTYDRLASERVPELAVRFFEMQLLGYLGYRPELHYCVHCREQVGPTSCFFSPSAGGILCLRCGQDEPTARRLSLNGFKVLRLLQKGDYNLVSRLRLRENLHREVEDLMRGYVQHVLEREVRSVSFLNVLRSDPLFARSAAGEEAGNDTEQPI